MTNDIWSRSPLLRAFLIVAVICFCMVNRDASAGPRFSVSKYKLNAEMTVIYAGKMIDTVNKKVREKVSIIVEKDKIKNVVDGFVDSSGAQLIDLSDMVVLPGLIDCHKHLSMSQLSPNHYEDLVTNTGYDAAFKAVDNARQTLLNGFTSVRDVGGHDGIDLSLKKAITNGVIAGPRMWVAGEPICPTGGHFDFASGIAMDITSPKWNLAIADGVDQILKGVRWRFREAVDLIKIMPSGGVGSIGTDPKLQLMTDEEIRIAIQTAHALGLKVAAHAHGKAAIDACLKFGVDSIEHGTYADEQSLSMMKEKGSVLVPTVYIARQLVELAEAKPPKLPPHVIVKAKEVAPIIQTMFINAVKMGVKIACGTDTFGNFRSGSPSKEITEMVRLGLDPMEAIISATIVASELIGLKGEIGSIATGNFADIIATKENPLNDITVLENVQFVMKGGIVYKEHGQAKNI